MDVFFELLQLRKMASYSHQYHAQFKKGYSVDIHGRKVYNAEDQPKIFRNQAGAQSGTTKWQNHW